MPFQRLFKRRHSSTVSRERTQRPGKKRGSYLKSPTVSTVFFDCIRPINRLKDRPFLPSITTHISLHITEPTRHFRNLLVEPVPTIPGGRDSAQEVIVGFSRARSDVTDLDYVGLARKFESRRRFTVALSYASDVNQEGILAIPDIHPRPQRPRRTAMLAPSPTLSPSRGQRNASQN